MKTIISYAVALGLFLSLSASAQTNVKKNDLRKTYNINLTKTSGKATSWQWTTDELSFHSGMLRSKMMHEHEKFEDASCSIDIDSSSTGNKMKGSMTFNAEKENTAGAKVKWNGTVKGKHIQGTVEFTNKEGKHTYTFTGNLKG